MFLRDYLDTGLGLITFAGLLDIALPAHDLSELAHKPFIIGCFFKEVLRVDLHFFFGLGANRFCNSGIVGLAVGLMRIHELIELMLIPVMKSALALGLLKFFIQMF